MGLEVEDVALMYRCTELVTNAVTVPSIVVVRSPVAYSMLFVPVSRLNLAFHHFSGTLSCVLLVPKTSRLHQFPTNSGR